MPSKVQIKRVWMIRTPDAAYYFDSKEGAKAFRDAFNDNPKAPTVKVSKGPDHPRLNDKGNPTTHTNGGNTGDGFRKTRRDRKSNKAKKG